MIFFPFFFFCDVFYSFFFSSRTKKRKKILISPPVERRDERHPVSRTYPRPRPAAELPVRVVDEHEDPGADGGLRPGDEEHVRLGRVGGRGGGGGDAGDGGGGGGAIIGAIIIFIVIIIIASFPLDGFDLELFLLFSVEDRLKPAAVGVDIVLEFDKKNEEEEEDKVRKKNNSFPIY